MLGKHSLHSQCLHVSTMSLFYPSLDQFEKHRLHWHSWKGWDSLFATQSSVGSVIQWATDAYNLLFRADRFDGRMAFKEDMNWVWRWQRYQDLSNTKFLKPWLYTVKHDLARSCFFSTKLGQHIDRWHICDLSKWLWETWAFWCHQTDVKILMGCAHDAHKALPLAGATLCQDRWYDQA